ncbi:MAG: N-6 DNA methylase [Planctomycetales bacterium]|nr:MAG: N-6 DNA methylase [Planctomycetales bacterium]
MSNYPAIRIEGGLISSDLLDQISAAELPGLKPADFGLPAKRNLTDEIAAIFAEARAQYEVFKSRRDRLQVDDIGTSTTRDFWMIPLLSTLGYQMTYNPKAYEAGGLSFAISHRAGDDEDSLPLHIVGFRQELGKLPASGRPRMAPHTLVQEYLNRTEHVWSIVSNGLTLRVLRDCSFIRRQAYIEFNLEQIFEDQRFPEFRLLYMLLHRSRFPQGIDDSESCLIEQYYKHSVEQGGRVRENLRDGVEQCIEMLANGFLSHSANDSLRNKLTLPSSDPDHLSAISLYRQLLRLVYRFLFLLVSEERGLISSDPAYRKYYGISRLRKAVDNRSAYSAYDDIWQGLRVLWQVLSDERMAAMFNAAPLNGELFAHQTLDSCSIHNKDFLEALHRLVYYEEKKGAPLRRVNYAALDVEELGSVYESLLEFHPEISKNGRGLPSFELVSGSERKTTGSYYTPPQLVNELIRSALEPVIEERLQAVKDKVPDRTSLDYKQRASKSLLGLRVCDPACGSGHFLLAAARRIGKELARVVSGEEEPAPDQTRESVREVISHCIYGVDKNPLAVDLCRVALWLESHYGEKPLSFLDHHIRCGDSLIGIFDLHVLSQGIPDAAYKDLEGDDKEVARKWKKVNKEQREGGNSLFGVDPGQALDQLAQAGREVDQLGDDSPEAVRRKKQVYIQNHNDEHWLQLKTACDMWCAAFFQPYQKGQPAITTEHVNDVLGNRPVDERLNGIALEYSEKLPFFHWPLEFPEVFADGGFDVVLGNPPWERVKLQEKEFFASRDSKIANAANKAARDRMIKALLQQSENSHQWQLYQSFREAKREAEAISQILRNSDQYPLCGRGDVNTYSVFAERNRNLIRPTGRVGCIVPTGIATDDTTKFFFQDLMRTKSLASLYDFENRAKLFPAVDSRMKFCLLTLTGLQVGVSKGADFVFFAHESSDLNEDWRHFRLTDADIALLNPNTMTCPVFRGARDAEITKQIYRQIPILVSLTTHGELDWSVNLSTMIHLTNDSNLLIPNDNDVHADLPTAMENDETLSPTFLRLFEGKMGHQYDHRFAGYYESDYVLTPVRNKIDPLFQIRSKYLMNLNDFIVVGSKWHESSASCFLGFRRVSRNNDERTSIACILPQEPNTYGWIVSLGISGSEQCLLLANYNSFILDYCLRNTLSQPSIPQGTFEQLPVLPPSTYKQATPWQAELTLSDWIRPRVLELSYTAWDLEPFGRDLVSVADQSFRDYVKAVPFDPAKVPYNLDHLLGRPGISQANGAAAQVGQPYANNDDLVVDGHIEEVATPFTIPPYRWDEARRFLLRCELDAAYFHLYGIQRDDVDYIMDTFPIVKRKDEAQYKLKVLPGEPGYPANPSEYKAAEDGSVEIGDYRTKRVILEIYDEMARAQMRGVHYKTRLEPPPASPECQHDWE